MRKIKLQGGIALTTVIVLSGVLLTTGIAIAITAIDLRKASEAATDNFVAESYSLTCLDESVNKLKFNPTYTGNFSLTLPDGDCSSFITNNANPNYKDVAIMSSKGRSIVEVSYVLDVSDYPFQIVN